MVTVAMTTQPTYRVGPQTGFKATGTIQGQDAEFKDDLLIQGDAEIVGTLYGAAVNTSGHLTVAVDKNITMGAAGGTGTGTFQTGTGNIALNGDITVATDKDILMVEAGTGTFFTGTGDIHLNGDATVANGKALAVTTADKLTVGGAIIPQELVIMADYKAADVDHTIFIASRGYTLVAAQHMSEIADTAGGAATVGIMKCTTNQAPSAGALMTTAAADLKAVTQVVTSLTPSATGANLVLAAGNRIALDFTGNTDGTGIVMVTLKRS